MDIDDTEGDTNIKPDKPLSRLQRFLDKFKGSLKFSLIFSISLHVAMIVIGAINLHNCPVESSIPIFLIIEGIIGIVSKLLGLFRNMLIKRIKLSPILSFLCTIELAYFICGSYWVYKEFKPSYNPQNGELYCNKTTYLFAFIYITIVYGILLIFAIGLACFLVCLYGVSKYVEKNEQKSEGDKKTETGDV